MNPKHTWIMRHRNKRIKGTDYYTYSIRVQRILYLLFRSRCKNPPLFCKGYSEIYIYSCAVQINLRNFSKPCFLSDWWVTFCWDLRSRAKLGFSIWPPNKICLEIQGTFLCMTYPIVHLSISYLSIDPSVGWGTLCSNLIFVFGLFPIFQSYLEVGLCYLICR
jgi:hypothetical protein